MAGSGRYHAGCADIGGATPYYEEAGSGSPVVFISGYTLDTRMWDDQIDAFAARHRVVRYDTRGTGRSPPPAGPYSQHTDLKALLDFLAIPRAHLVGLSRGGATAINFALASPDAVLSLIPVGLFLDCAVSRYRHVVEPRYVEGSCYRAPLVCHRLLEFGNALHRRPVPGCCGVSDADCNLEVGERFRVVEQAAMTITESGSSSQAFHISSGLAVSSGLGDGSGRTTHPMSAALSSAQAATALSLLANPS